jgi:hypothetical protein
MRLYKTMKSSFKYLQKRQLPLSITIYASTTNKPLKRDIMNDIATGASHIEQFTHVIHTYEMVWNESDIAVVFGYFPTVPKTDTTMFRKTIKNFQTKAGKQCIFVDSDIFRGTTEKEYAKHTHYRMAYGSIYPGEANFFNNNMPGDRWELIKARKELTLYPWRKTGNHIVMFTQRGDDGWSMAGKDRYDWINETIIDLRKHTDRAIIIRPHPNATQIDFKRINDPINKTTMIDSKNVSMTETLMNAWASIIFNSGPSVASVLHGIPLFITDKRCIAAEVANMDISKIEDPNLPDVVQWLHNIAYTVWDLDELKNGTYWRHMIKGLENSGNR